MRLKRLFSIVLAGIMTAGLLAGCGSSKTDNAASKTTENSTASTEDADSDETAEPTQAADETTDSTTDSSTEGNGNVLVVYYSATGSTKSVAETIADATGGDLFEIEPKEPYTSDDLNWSNDDSRVSREHDNEDQRNVELVSTTVDNGDSYDTVFIGYPKMEYSL